MSEHNWHQVGHRHLLGLGPQKVYKCVTRHCGVLGYTTEHSWPPMPMVGLGYRTCEEAIQAKIAQELKKYDTAD